MMQKQLRRIEDGQKFRHKGRVYRRKGNKAVGLDGGGDLLLDALDMLIMLDIIDDGEINMSPINTVETDVYTSMDSGGDFVSDSGADFGSDSGGDFD